MGKISASVIPAAGGTITPSSLSFSSGDMCTFSLSLNSGYSLDGWLVAGNGSSDYNAISTATAKGLLNSDGYYDSYQTASGYERFQIYNPSDSFTGVAAMVTSSTTDTKLTFTTKSVTGATLSPTSLTASEGSTISLLCKLDDGYTFQYWVMANDDWVSNNETISSYKTSSSGNEYFLTLYNVTSSRAGEYSVKVKANTTTSTYTITKPSNSNYATFTGNSSIASGSNATITATVIDGKALDYWTINGISIQNNATGSISSCSYQTYSTSNQYFLQLSNVSSALAIDAYFKDTNTTIPDVSVDESKYINLYSDAQATNLSYPRTKAGAITLEDGTNLESVLAQLKTLL